MGGWGWGFENSKRKCPSIPSNVYFNETESTSGEESCELSMFFLPSSTSQQEAEAAVSSLPTDAVDDIFNITSDMIITASSKFKSS